MLSLVSATLEIEYATQNDKGVFSVDFFLVSYVGERPWWPIQSPNKGRKKKAKELRDQIKFIYLRFDRWQVIRFSRAIRQNVP